MPEAATGLRARLQSSWYSAGAYPLLLPLAAVYGLALRMRRLAYRSGLFSSRHPGVPVVVVGNITVGGTGKTPLTLWLAQQLLSQGIRVGIATRGYGRNGRGVAWAAATSDPLEVGDEPVLLARRSGALVCVAPARLQAARLLAERGCQLVLCDDGLQHLALRRDLEIAVLDGQRGIGNGALLPAGPLREPAEGLSRFPFVVVNGPQTPGGIPVRCTVLHMTLHADDTQALLGDASRPFVQWRGESVHAVAGIGHPQRFFDSLRGAGLDVTEHVFPDHHHYEARDLVFGDQRSIVMTEKDAVKCQAFADSRMWVAPVSAQFSPADAAQLLTAVRRAASLG